MKRATIAGGVLASVLVVLALAAGYRAGGSDVERAAPPAAADPLATGDVPEISGMPDPAEESRQGFLYGRVTTTGGATHEGRLRWGGDQEAFWGDYFNGFKDENPWAAHVPAGRLPKVSRPLEFFGIEIARRESPAELGRPFMARFGEISRIEARGGDVRVTLKSGTVFDLDRFEASDFDDGVRVWDGKGGVVDLDSLRIRTVELLPSVWTGTASGRLHGTVRTRQGDFTGFLQWDRKEGLGSDELDGRSAEGQVHLRFDTVRAIARRSPKSSLVTLRDGRELVLSGSREAGEGNLGVYVDDRRYGRVLVSWEAFERVDFSPEGLRDSRGEGGGASGETGPAYGDFPPGRPLTGSVTTRDGRRLAGRLVFDLDESESTETLDAPFQGVDYTLPFGRIAAIVPPGRDEPGKPGARSSARVVLHGGEELQLERAGDLGDGNAGMLVFVDGGERPEYLPWSEIGQVDLDRPTAVALPGGPG